MRILFDCYDYLFYLGVFSTKKKLFFFVGWHVSSSFSENMLLEKDVTLATKHTWRLGEKYSTVVFLWSIKPYDTYFIILPQPFVVWELWTSLFCVNRKAHYYFYYLSRTFFSSVFLLSTHKFNRSLKWLFFTFLKIIFWKS
jgi:hypothetical protein